MLDLAIIGSGPAALTAAIYVARAGLLVTVFEKKHIGGALTEIAKIENFPGFTGAGQALADQLRAQATSAGATVRYGELKQLSATAPFSLRIDDETVSARAVLVATGSEPRPLDFTPSAPVAYCVLCDAPLYQGKDVAVVGGGNSAVQESLHLAQTVRSIHLFSHSALTAEPYLIKKLRALDNVTITENVAPTPELLADYAGVFVLIGKRPATTFLDSALLDDRGFIKTVDYQTATLGLFAAGDVRSGSLKQAITAAADGAIAATKIIDFLRK